jgi:hypothetical protein
MFLLQSLKVMPKVAAAIGSQASQMVKPLMQVTRKATN